MIMVNFIGKVNSEPKIVTNENGEYKKMSFYVSNKSEFTFQDGSKRSEYTNILVSTYKQPEENISKGSVVSVKGYLRSFLTKDKQNVHYIQGTTVEKFKRKAEEVEESNEDIPF